MNGIDYGAQWVMADEPDETGPTCCRCGTEVSEDARAFRSRGRMIYYCSDCEDALREDAADARRG